MPLFCFFLFDKKCRWEFLLFMLLSYINANVKALGLKIDKNLLKLKNPHLRSSQILTVHLWLIYQLVIKVELYGWSSWASTEEVLWKPLVTDCYSTVSTQILVWSRRNFFSFLFSEIFTLTVLFISRDR